MAIFTVHRWIDAPRDVVFDVLTDHRGYQAISVFRSATLEREGEPSPDGVGAIRALTVAGPPMREQVTAFERPSLMEYKALSGVPARSHTAKITLEVQGAGTFLSYRVDSVPKIPMPAAAWAAVLRPGFKRLVHDIAKEAERRSSDGSLRTATVAIVLSEAGYHWEEAAAAYNEWDAAHWDVVFYTPTGAVPTPDPTSLRYTPLPFRMVGYGTSREDGPESVWGRKLLALINSPRSLSEFDLDGTDVIYVVGGHGALQDIDRNEDLHRIIEALYLKGGVLSSVCHATSTFAFAKRPDGTSIVRDKRLTGCPNLADDLMIRFGMVHKAYLPLPLINDDELRRAGAHLTPRAVAAANAHETVVDVPFITGVGPKAASGVARKVMQTWQAESDPAVTH